MIPASQTVYPGEELLIAGLALVIATGSAAAGLGGWRWPYRLRSVRYVRRRFGSKAARGVLFAVAAVMLAAATAILSELSA